MLGADKTVTIINHYFDKGTDADVYICHALNGCSWYAQLMNRSETNGLVHAQLYKVRIPADAANLAGFCQPDDWAALPGAKKAQYWTLTPGSRMVLGVMTDVDATAYAALGKRTGACTVLGWHDNTGREMAHWYVEGS